MKMPDRLEEGLLAPCGVNCGVCYKHVMNGGRAKPCVGCLVGDAGKAARCRECRIKTCAQERGLVRCFACGEFPCTLVKNLDRSYLQRYGVSLVESGRRAAEVGLAAFLEEERRRWTCPACGGAFSMHDGICSECGGMER